MRILHLSTLDAGSGAAIAAYRLHAGLRRLGHDSRMLVARRRLDDPTVQALLPPSGLVARVARWARRARMARDARRYPRPGRGVREMFSDDRSPLGAGVARRLPDADVVNVHSMFGFLDYRAFLSTVPARIPVVRTLHDMSFFTGGCHYDHGCGRFTARCGCCPQLGARAEHDLSRDIWQRKLRAFRTVPADRLYLVAPSRWLAGEASRSSLLSGFPVHVIPNGLDTEVFQPRDRAAARAVLALPQDARVVLFVSEPVFRATKGFPLLVEALSEVSRPPFLVSVGSGTPPVNVPGPHLHLGHVADERFLSVIYSAADLLALPSLEDNLPSTALEALACGTPIVAFAVGGVVDIVRPDITGAVVPARDCRALGRAMMALLDSPEKLAALRASCRRVAVEEYSVERQVRAYVELYRSILDRTRPTIRT